MSEDVGFISVDAWSEASFVVPIEHFDFDNLDAPEDLVRQRISEGKPIAELVKAWAGALAEQNQADTVRALLSLIIQAKKPRQRVDEIAFACGMFLSEGETIISLAKRHGISKQAFQRGVMTVCETLNLRKTRTMRSDEACKTMRRTNFRRTKP